ncbi:DNA repair protein RecN [Cerasicoccus arenae]|uniref:DNA repair protein RecN n=1 Tax=Cerasicoccus arenae TaxID=424488 RepID=A0A8J3DHA6_9BACT|nr:DNA repair protein RecN [Cerasicoccus arenae]GHB92775.1 DNA repair protein RecN [Cerasicoccus arenae]
MLQYLHICNLALLDEISLDFEPGFTAVTGETGAGKSVLLGALSLLAGNRAEKSIIRSGAEECVVEAALHVGETSGLGPLLAELDLPPCEDNTLILRRSLHRQRGGKVMINGVLATVTALQQLGEVWIDFHGPGEPQKLFHEKNQLSLLDIFARNGKPLEAYQTDFDVWRGIWKEMENLRTAERISPEEAEFLQSQIDAINEVNPNEDSIEALERDFKRLDNARELSQLSEQTRNGARQAARAGSAVLRAARELAEIDSAADVLAGRLDALILEAEDLADEYDTLASGGDFDPNEAEQIQRRMQTWLQIRRKYGPTTEAVRAKRDELVRRIGSQTNVEGQIIKLEHRAKEMEKGLRQQADELRRRRLKGAKELSAQARELLTKLGFKKADFSIEVETEEKLSRHGHSNCRFLFSPNVGQPLMQLNKIASSGETARVMLALKAVLAKADSTALLVFDEVDANVGGEIGAAVGRELAALAGDHQVFCVTHLPQVAALARQHFLVEKGQDEKETTVSIRRIDQDKQLRESELARMLGDRDSNSAREHARQLMAR